MGYGIDQIEKMLLYQDTLNVITRALSILISLVNATVILVMFVKCTKFRRTRRYDDYSGIKTLSKWLEIIVILLAIDAVYGLTRIFPIIDTINLINSAIPDFPQSVYAYLIFITVVLPILSCTISIFAWGYYQKTRSLFFSVYPNGVQKIEFTSPTVAPDDDIFGSSSVANLNYGSHNAAVDQAKLEQLLVQDTPETEYKVTPAQNNNGGEDIFGTGSNLWEAVPDMSDPLISEILVAEDPTEKQETLTEAETPVYKNEQEVFFGAGTTEDYMKKFTTADDDIISQLLVQDEPAEQ